MNKRVNYNAREFAGRIKTSRKRECQRCRGSYRSEKLPWRTRSLWFAGRRGDCIWLVHVIFPHVQMTCQLPLNYMRHLDRSAQCQRWLILFIVAAMTVPVETERHKKHRARHYGRDLEKAAGDGIAREGLTADFCNWWSGMPPKISDGNHFLRVEMAWGMWQHLDWKKKKKKADVAYSRGKANVIAQHNPRSAYTHFHVDGCLPSHLNIMSS